MNKTSPEIHELKRRFEDQLRRKIKTPKDFIFLSGVVWDRTHETISPTTLKRLWGYIDGADQARSSTLDILSKALGFKDWDDFLADVDNKGGSDLVVSPHVSADDLKEGSRVAVSWNPDRHCVFRYLGNTNFIVEEALNSKLKKGDTFSATLFILNEPLFLNNLIQGHNPPVPFVIGNRDGLREIEVL
ncbi:MAG: hypothetical protein IJK32_08525 [Bacteroidales bacterium]|nr:hypothetical protein [Bacteroidales bacterium]